MKLLGYEEVSRFAGTYQNVPIGKEIYSDVITPISLLRRLSTHGGDYFLLESVENGEKIGRYSFVGYEPEMQISCRKGRVFYEEAGVKKEAGSEPFAALRSLLDRHKAPRIEGMPPFTGGVVGYFSYELIGLSEPRLQLREGEFPLYDLMLFDKVVVFDHLLHKIFVIANVNLPEKEKGYEEAVHNIDEMIRIIYDSSPLPERKVAENVIFTSSQSKEAYCRMVERTKKYIYEGDIFQAVISRRFEAEYKESLLNAYRVMRTINPSPYMYYMKCKDVEIAGVSPETLIKLEEGVLTTFPVAGTRRRGTTMEEDQQLEAELLQDEKELAEHNMLVDLARNDMGRISKYGTVKVGEYQKIHKFSKVMHIASVVNGELLPGKDQLDTIAAMLPAGTLSGAPKFRACEIISELEPYGRGVYGGAIGYLDLSGNLDVCIGIRTAVKKQDKVYVQAGAGIVADSVPESEYEETYNKAKAIMEAIERASEVNGL